METITVTDLYETALIHKQAKDYNNYFTHMTMAANKNHLLAITDLTDAYYHKFHKKQNHLEMLSFYETTQSYSHSANYLGLMYMKGYGVIQNKDLAEQLLKFAVNLDNTNAMINLALLYLNHKYALYIEKSIGLITRAYNSNNPNSIYYMATIFQYNRQAYQQAIDLFMIDAKKNNPKAMYQISICYFALSHNTLETTEILKYYALSLEFTQKAIQYGSYNAYIRLGNLYESGYGVPVDYNEAIKNYKLAMSKTYKVHAMASLCHIYADKKLDIEDLLEYCYDIRQFEFVKSKFNLSSEALAIFKKYYKFKKENIELKIKNQKLNKQNDELMTHVKASPDGEFFLAALEDWYHNISRS